MSTSAPGAPAAPPAPSGQGSPTPSSQPPASGQGQGQGQGTTSQDGFNWGLFPDVPEGQRELLRPHLTNVLGHVTRMEQQYAPYKGLTEAVPPDQVQGLMTFLNNYSEDPLATWLGLAQSLQQSGAINNPAFNMDALQQMISGQPPQGAGPSVAAAGGGEQIPPWAQQIMSRLDQYDQAEQARQQAMEQQQEQQILQDAHATMREQLTAAQIPEELLTDEQLTAALIVHQGDIQQAVNSFTSQREGFLKGFVGQNGAKPPPTVGNVSAPQTGLKGKRGDAFRQASLGAEQMLRQNSAAEAQ